MSNRQTFFLDLPTLLTHLRGQSCELTTELKVSKRMARGIVICKEGKIVQCMLSFQDGSQITGELAYKQLETSTHWQVEWEEPPEKKKIAPSAQISQRPTQPNLPAYPLPPLPLRQKRPLDAAFLRSLSAKQRLLVNSVLVNVNGNRTSDDIKAQLRLSPRDIDSALEWLRSLDVIE